MGNNQAGVISKSRLFNNPEHYFAHEFKPGRVGNVVYRCPPNPKHHTMKWWANKRTFSQPTRAFI
jgi:hypothetical protein